MRRLDMSVEISPALNHMKICISAIFVYVNYLTLLSIPRIIPGVQSAG
jgi:hypothetical protein